MCVAPTTFHSGFAVKMCAPTDVHSGFLLIKSSFIVGFSLWTRLLKLIARTRSHPVRHRLTPATCTLRHVASLNTRPTMKMQMMRLLVVLHLVLTACTRIVRCEWCGGRGNGSSDGGPCRVEGPTSPSAQAAFFLPITLCFNMLTSHHSPARQRSIWHTHTQYVLARPLYARPQRCLGPTTPDPSAAPGETECSFNILRRQNRFHCSPAPSCARVSGQQKGYPLALQAEGGTRDEVRPF